MEKWAIGSEQDACTPDAQLILCLFFLLNSLFFIPQKMIPLRDMIASGFGSSINTHH
jgi:hypothetical protein